MQKSSAKLKADRLAGGMSAKGALLHDLLKLNNRLMAPFSTHLAHQYRISLNEFRLLMNIGVLGRTASHEVADITGVNVMSVSRAVATLQRDGRVHVERDSANRRRKWLSLTEEGQSLYEAMRPQSEKVANYVFSELEESELKLLDNLVARLTSKLEDTDDAGGSAFLEATKADDE